MQSMSTSTEPLSGAFQNYQRNITVQDSPVSKHKLTNNLYCLGAYKNHLLKCRFELSSFDLMPDEFLPTCDVEFTMPMATVSHTVVRPVSIDSHEDPDRVEKFVRYVAKYNYKVILTVANL